MRKTVLFNSAANNPPEGLDLLRKRFDTIDVAGFSSEDLVRHIGQAHVLFGYGVAVSHFAEAPNLEIIGSPSSGVETIDLQAATAAGVVVVNAAGAQCRPVAETAVGLMLSVSKRIGISDRWAHTERHFPDRSRFIGDGWPHGYPHELDGKRLGIVGFGFIGRDVAEKCRLAFNMQVMEYDPYFDDVEAARQHVEPVSSLSHLLPRSDFLCLCLPYSAATHHLIGEAELRMLPSHAVLVNVSRGGTVDQEALVRALTEGWISAAGLDVFDPEPLPDGHPLFDLENVVISAHIGGTTEEAFPRLSVLCAQEVLMADEGRRPRRLCNPDVWPVFEQRRARESSD